MSNQALDEAVRQCNELIAYHRDNYERAIKPIIDRLILIENVRPRRYFVSVEDWVQESARSPL